MIAIDYVGIGVVISAMGTSAAAVIAAVYGVKTHTVTTDTRAAVTTTNGATMAELAEAAETRRTDTPDAPSATP